MAENALVSIQQNQISDLEWLQTEAALNATIVGYILSNNQINSLVPLERFYPETRVAVMELSDQNIELPTILDPADSDTLRLDCSILSLHGQILKPDKEFEAQTFSDTVLHRPYLVFELPDDACGTVSYTCSAGAPLPYYGYIYSARVTQRYLRGFSRYDWNEDSMATVTDVVLCRKAILNGEGTTEHDLNGDSTLSVTDVVLLRKFILNPPV